MTDHRALRPTADEAFAAYAALVAANREQIERLREYVPGTPGDFWAGRAGAFRPGVLPAPESEALHALVQPEDTWLDIGAGGGRFAIPLSRHVARVIAVDPSPAMRGVLAATAAEEGRANIEVVDLRWPPGSTQPALVADVALAANVVYDIDDMRGFLAAMEAHARQTCVVIVADRSPSAADPEVWQALYREPICTLPALREFVALLGALGRRYEVRTFPPPAHDAVDPTHAREEAYLRYWVTPGSERAARLHALLVERFGDPIQLPPRRNYTAVVSWASPVP